MKLKAQNFKGMTFSEELTGLDFFTGNNGSGKSARINALHLALLGNIPGMSKDTREIMKLTAWDSMAVSLETDNFAINRVLEMNQKIKKTGEKATVFSSNVQLKPCDLSGKKEIEAEIAKKFILTTLDFDEFTNLSDEKKRKYFDQFVDIDEKMDLTKEMKERLLTPLLKRNDPDRYENMEFMIETYIQDEKDTNEFIKKILPILIEDKKAADDTYKKAFAAAEKLKEMKNKFEKSERDLKIHKQELSDFSEQIGSIDASEREVANYCSQQQQKADLQARLSELKKPEGTSKIDTAIEEFVMTVILDFSSGEKQISEKISDLEKLQRKAANGIKNNEKEQYRYKSLIEKIQKAKGTCVLSKEIKCNNDFTSVVAEFEEKIKEYEKEIIGFTSDSKIFQDAIDAENNEKLRLIGITNDTRNERRKEEKLLDELKSERRIRQNQRDNYISLKKMYTDQIEAIEALKEPEKITGKEEILKEMSALKMVINEEEQIKHTYLNMQDSVSDYTDADLDRTNLKYMIETLGLKGIQGELLKKNLSGVKDMVDENLKILGVTYDFYFQTESERQKEIFQFGWINSERKIDFEALSGAEQIILMSAIVTAFMEIAKPELKILTIDNIDRVHPDNLPGLLAGLESLKMKKLDEVLIAGVVEVDDFYAIGSWNVRKLEGGFYVES